MDTVVNKNQRLFYLLERCSEEKNEAEKLEKITDIIDSPDFTTVRSSEALKEVYNTMYSFPVLDSLDVRSLEMRKDLLRQTAELYRRALYCVQGGNGYELTEEDAPDFMSKQSLSRVLDRMNPLHSKTNYTNISEKDVFQIFSDKTVKSARECFDMLPVSTTTGETIEESVITESMGNKFYCIPIGEFRTVHREFLNLVEKSKQTHRERNIRRGKHILLKIAVTMLCFGTVFAFSQFNLISGSFSRLLYAVIMFVSFLYMIWG